MRSVRTVSLLLAVAAGLHLAALPSHVEEGSAVAAFFGVMAVGQLIAAFVVYRGSSARARAVIAAGTLGIVAVWAMSRTVGFPYFGHDGDVEPVALLDALSVVAELAAVAGLYALSAVRSPRPTRWAGLPALAVVALLVAAAGLPLAPSEHAHAEEAHEAPALHVHAHAHDHGHDH
jgi:hypothetical protein